MYPLSHTHTHTPLYLPSEDNDYHPSWAPWDSNLEVTDLWQTCEAGRYYPGRIPAVLTILVSSPEGEGRHPTRLREGGVLPRLPIFPANSLSQKVLSVEDWREGP